MEQRESIASHDLVVKLQDHKWTHWAQSAFSFSFIWNVIFLALLIAQSLMHVHVHNRWGEMRLEGGNARQQDVFDTALGRLQRLEAAVLV